MKVGSDPAEMREQLFWTARCFSLRMKSSVNNGVMSKLKQTNVM